MKVVAVLICSLAIICGTLSAPQLRANEQDFETRNEDGVLTKALPCDPELCRAPTCRCSSTSLNNQITIEQTPQLVMLTFDDAVTAANYQYIHEILGNRFNPDGCPAAATFFVSHEYTDYSKVHALWTEGHEIALHSISHQPNTQYWKNASVDLLMREFNDQRDLIAHFAQMDREDIKGIRVPLFQLAGNNTFEMIQRAGLLYDCSMPSQHFVNPGMWPYSLDYATTQDCTMGDCPTASLPNVWVAPILSWFDTEGYPCAMIDACQYLPDDDEELMFQWMKSNFDRHYNGNRAPFGVFIHAAWFLLRESHLPAYKRLVEYMNSLPNVYMVSVSRAVEYTQNPRPWFPEDGQSESEPTEELSEEWENEQQPELVDEEGNQVEGESMEVKSRKISKRGVQIMDTCQKMPQSNCQSRLCQLTKEENNEERWMTACVPCPAVYPWLDNPLGVDKRQ